MFDIITKDVFGDILMVIRSPFWKKTTKNVIAFLPNKKKYFSSVKTSLWWQLVGFQFDHIHH